MNSEKILLCSDIDGTLIHVDEQRNIIVSAQDIGRITDFINSGNDFALVTGRNLLACKMFTEEYHIDCSYIISNSGACITDRNDRYLYRESIRKEDIEFIRMLCKEYDVESYEISDGDISSITILKPEMVTDETMLRVNFEAFKAKEETILNGEGIVEIGVHFFNEEEMNRFANRLEEEHSKVICHFNGLNLDITGTDCSKYKAIRFLEEMNRYKKIYTIGDGLNDLEMISEYEGFAVESAADEVKRKAKYVVKNVYECLEMIEVESNE